MKNLLPTLINLGIDKKIAKIYLACLELGKASIKELAEKSKIKRTTIYNFLEEIKHLGLISELKEGKKTIFIPENPQKIIKNLQSNLTALEKEMPNFLKLYNNPSKKAKVHFYRGKNGIKKAYEDYALKNQPIYGFANYKKMLNEFDNKFLFSLPQNRVKKKCPLFVIAEKSEKSALIQSLDKKQLRKTKLAENLKIETEINIYGQKISIISFKKPYTSVIIEDSAIAKSLKSIWELIWNNLD